MINKQRIGFSASFIGLFLVIGSLYLDQIRGEQTVSLGLFQIAAAIIGYTLLAVGLVVALKNHDTHKSVRNILLVGGGSIALVSLLADYVGAATPSGFDRFQAIGLLVGIILVGIGYFLPQGLF